MLGRRAFLKGLLGAGAALVVVPTLADAEGLARRSGALPPRKLYPGGVVRPPDDDRLAALVRRGVPIVGGDYLLHRPLVLDRGATLRHVSLRLASDFAGDTTVHMRAEGAGNFVLLTRSSVEVPRDGYGVRIERAAHAEISSCRLMREWDEG